jgi:hypothetical protein
MMRAFLPNATSLSYKKSGVKRSRASPKVAGVSFFRQAVVYCLTEYWLGADRGSAI